MTVQSYKDDEAILIAITQLCTTCTY
uniref:Uncharacterized protein n=1 Tax=Arundo donax TaxID=35708 RepID=A0A0A9H2H8_ARUDO